MVKKDIFMLILLGMVFPTLAQTGCNDTIVVFGSPIKDFPVFRKDSTIMDFFIKNMRYPETAQNDRIEGKVIVKFWVDENGYVSEQKIVKGVRDDLDEEVLRVIKLIEKFDKPAMNYNGQTTGMCFHFTISFRLSEKNGPLFGFCSF